MKILTLERLRVRRALILLACAAAAGFVHAQTSDSLPRLQAENLLLDGVPPLDAALAERLARFTSSRAATFLDWLPDGSMLISTRFGNAAQVHRVAAPLGMREQLTYSSEPITVAAVPQLASADGFAFLRDRGGDENSQLYYFHLPDRSVRLLTDGKSMHGSPVWSRDGKHLAFYGTGRNGVDYDVYVLDATPGAVPRLLVAGRDDAWYPLDWSLDGQKLLVQQYVSINESYLYVADVTSGALTALDTSGHKIGIRAARFAPDGSGVYVSSDDGGEFAQLRYLNPSTRESRPVVGGLSWDIDAFDVSADGRYIAYLVNENGRSRLTVLDTRERRELSPPGLPDGPISTLKFDRMGARLALTAETAQSPADVYVYEPEHNSLVRWTQSELGPLDPSVLVPAQSVRYPTWDRAGGGPRMLSAYLYLPRTSGPHPVLVYIHGGPESQFKPGFDPFLQFAVNELGYAVLAPNVRGSAGYGRSFLKLDDGLLREDAVRDIGSLLVWIGLQGELDRNHVVVMGTSYGGYMALASLAAYNDRLRGGIDVVGISNFVSFLEHTSAYRRALRRAEYGDERDPRVRAYLNRISPLTNASEIRRPLLIVAGLNDPRVPPAESTQMIGRIRAAGGEVWYLAAKDEGHGFRKKANRDAYYAAAAAFLERVAH
jgi:dipeptidyl aminopeptidase/acylaminoacyl peptidase